MTLRRTLLLVNAALFIALLAIAGGSLAGLYWQREHVKASLREYSGLKRVESAGIAVAQAKARLHDPGVSPADLAPQLRQSLADMREYKAMLAMYDRLLPEEVPADQQKEAKEKTRAVTAHLAGLVDMLESGKPVDESAFAASADEATAELTSLLRVCNTFLNQTELASQRDIQRAFWPVMILAILVPVTAALLSLWQYRNISRPLQSLRAWSRRLAHGDFSHPYEPQGPPEFRELGRDFNTMAMELERFYRELEEMVASKSRELVRSERLASVGYLAAGVAHEINSPLNIMSGYAELSVKRLKRVEDHDVVSEVLAWQEVIREEAFRCKQITGKLLSLARGGREGAGAVSITRLASEVAMMVRGLRNFEGRKLAVDINPVDPLETLANETEIKQVMLNLFINALEAVSPGTGHVTVFGRRDGDSIELAVHDNGRGILREDLGRIFEPFFTDKRGAGEPGTGLGLSITHAIVADHGGRIWAESDGAGRGSRFIVRLPALMEESEPARVATGEHVAGGVQ